MIAEADSGVRTGGDASVRPMPDADAVTDAGTDAGADAGADAEKPPMTLPDPPPDSGSDCADADRDGHYDIACGGDDCDDGDPAIHPEAAEVCGNAVDDDCNPDTPDDLDADQDGVSCVLDCDDDDPAEPATSGSCDGALYRHDFEAGPAGWVASGENSSWAYGRPNATFIDRAASGRHAWVTNLSGDYNDDEVSYLTSPSLDLSGLERDPVLMLSLIFDTGGYDAVTVERSLDGGDFRVVGAFGGGFGWYTRSNDWYGRSGEPGQWHAVFHRLDGVAGRSDVRIRFAFRSDVVQSAEGVGVDDVRVLTDLPDLAVQPLQLQSVACADRDDVIVTADVLNTGNHTFTNVRLAYAVGDQPPVTQDFAETLAPGEQRALRFDARASLATPGEHVIRVWVDDGADGFAHNDAAEASATTLVTVSGADYAEDFERDDGGFLAYGLNSTWRRGRPGGAHISSAASGEHAWFSQTIDPFSPERSFLQSPCFDLSALQIDPVLHFSHIYDIEDDDLNFGFVQISIDGGRSWQMLGAPGNGDAWYDEEDGWTGTSGAPGSWRVASHRLTGSAGNSAVTLRFALDTCQGCGEGMAIDDVRVASSVTDLALASARVQAEVGCSGRSSDPLRVDVRNLGTQTVAGFDLSYSVDGGPFVTEHVAQMLAPDGNYRHTFLLGSELAAIGTHDVTVRVSASGDQVPGNDTATLRSFTQQVVTGLQYSSDFEIDDGGWRAGGEDSSWAWGEPNGGDIRNAASGSRAWVTGLLGDYNPNEHSTLTSPCLSFAGEGEDPTLQFSHIYDSDGFENVAWLEISLDGGNQFTKLGSAESGAGWYDDHFDDTWAGYFDHRPRWHTASHVLHGAAGEGAVVLRFVFVVDALFGFVTEEGHAIDDVAILP